MKWGEAIQTGGECPVWLKSDEMFAYTNAFGEWAERAVKDSADCRTWFWEHIGKIKMPEGHRIYEKPHGLVLEKPADWAVERAYKLFISDKPAYALARYIEQYEEPPVDSDVLAVREIIDAWYNGQALEVTQGLCDERSDFQAALAAYRRHRNV